MGAGCPGDNPLSDILTHGLEPFPLDMCVLEELIGNKGVNQLTSSDIKYWEWENNIDLYEGRKYLLGLCPANIKTDSIYKNSKQLLKIAREFYSSGLANKEFKEQYWKLSLIFFIKAKEKVELTGKNLEIYNMLQS